MPKNIADRPLTALQIKALRTSEDTLFGDRKLTIGFGRSIAGLRKRGFIEGDAPHIYVTEAGRKVI